MGQYIIKAAHDRPEYLIYSTVVGAPIFVFLSRDELLEHLEQAWLATNAVYVDGVGWTRAESMVTHPYPPIGFDAPAERVRRADETGTSAPLGQVFGEDLMVVEGTPDHPDDHYWVIPRDKLGDWCQLVAADDENTADALLELRAE